MSYESNSKGYGTEDMTFAQMKKLLKGEQGIQGFSGHSPIHVQESQPTGFDVQKGDLWHQPSTEKLRLFNGDKWKEIARRGEMGFAGADGKDGKDGKKGDKGETGDIGPVGPAGKAADMTVAKKLADKSASDAVKAHEDTVNHDPFQLGSYKVNEKGLMKGMALEFNGQEFVYRTPQNNPANQLLPYWAHGYALPSQEGNSGKVLQSGGTQGSETWVSSSSAVNYADKEVPTGTINGSNVTFTLAHTPTAGSEHVYLNGVLQTSGTDYTIATATITFTSAPLVGSDFTTKLVVSYRY